MAQQGIFTHVLHVVSIVTDWLLIAAGILLLVMGALRIDVDLARYAVLAIGILLTGSGLWFRHRRRKTRP